MDASALLHHLLTLGGALLLGVALGAPAAAQERSTIVGTVLDEATLRPIAGATVSLMDASIQTRTDEQGNFMMPDVPVGSFSMRAVAEGYSGAVDQVVVTSEEVGYVQVLLLPVTLLLNEVLVQTGRRTPNSVPARTDGGAMTAADLLKQTVPGLSMRSGPIGIGTVVTIRGVKSVQLATRPSIYLDGVRITDSSAMPGGSGGRMAVLDDIPAADVRRIRVLKGPSAAVMFSDSANGIILIETVRGIEGQ